MFGKVLNNSLFHTFIEQTAMYKHYKLAPSSNLSDLLRIFMDSKPMYLITTEKSCCVNESRHSRMDQAKFVKDNL